MAKQSLELKLINFTDDCITRAGSEVILEAMDEAIRMTESRLGKIGKTFPAVEKEGQEALSAITEMRREIASWPICGAPKGAMGEAKKRIAEAKSKKKGK